MQGRAYLDLAREVVLGGTEAHWRATVIHSYYALLLECRDALSRWGWSVPPHQNVHSEVRLCLIFATDADLKTIGRALDFLVQDRNRASYNTQARRVLIDQSLAQARLREATNALALLDQIDGNSTRRAAAIAALPPP